MQTMLREIMIKKIYSLLRGSTENQYDPVPTPYLQAVRAQVISNAACLLRYPLYISSSNICTNSPIGTPCRILFKCLLFLSFLFIQFKGEGDEGGALTILESDHNRTQIGIFSYQFSVGCGRGWPAVFTRITSYLVSGLKVNVRKLLI